MDVESRDLSRAIESSAAVCGTKCRNWRAFWSVRLTHHATGVRVRASASARARRRNCPFLSDSQTDMHNILELVHRVGDGGNISRLLIPGSIKISCIKLAAVIENSKLICRS